MVLSEIPAKNSGVKRLPKFYRENKSQLLSVKKINSVQIQISASKLLFKAVIPMYNLFASL